MTHLFRPTRLHSFAAGAVALAGIAAHPGRTDVVRDAAPAPLLLPRHAERRLRFQAGRLAISANSREPFAFAAIYNFNGHGFARGQSTRSVNGVISRVHFVVLYTLNRTCAGTETLRDSTGGVRHYVIYVLPSGRQNTYLRADPGVVAAGSAVAG